MKKLFVTVPALLVAAAALPAAAAITSPSAVGLVHVDERDAGTYYNYLAAVPVFRYWDDALLYEAPLLADVADVTPPAADGDATAHRMVVVGPADEAKVAAVRDAYNVPRERVQIITGDAVAVAAALAANWAQARNVVIAPTGDKDDAGAAASAAYAAVLASTLNAPMLYVYGKRAPGETLGALARLRAANVYVVDIRGALSDDVLAAVSQGRYESQVLTSGEDVDNLIEFSLRKARANNLPLDA